jgi:outer membrane protein TolC
LHSLEYEKQRVQLEASASIRAGTAVLTQLIHRHDVLDSTLLPTADEAYTTLQQAYNAGRLPYTNLLAVERALIELRFEHNDVLLAIHNQVIALERISGVRLQRDFE